MKANETILKPSDLFANEAEFNTDKLAEAAAYLAEDAEIFANRAEEEAAAPCYIESAEVIAQFAADAKEAAEKAMKRAAKAAEESGRAKTEKAAELAADAARYAEKAKAAAKRAADILAAFVQAKEEAAEESAAAPELGEGRKADILAKLAAAFDSTKNKCIAITLNNYLHTAENIAAEEFTEKIYNWYLDALKNFGFSFEAAAPESGSEEEEGEEAAAPEYQEAAADLVKTAAAVVVGFIGFYITFAIFGI